MNRIKNKIVIFERDESLRESLNLILEDDFTLLFANSVKEVLDYINSQRIKLFILDIDNISNNLKLIKQIKTISPELNILLLSVNFKLAFQEKAIKIGTDIRFQEKPFNPNGLLERIHTIIRGYSLKRHTHVIRIKNT